MALKFTVDSLDGLPAGVREHYTKVGDKYQLATEGSNPRVDEFRSSNISMARELEELRPLKAKYEGVDPDEYRTLKAKAAAGDSSDLVALRTELAAEKAARAAAQTRADALVLETKISDAFLRAGGLPKARAFIVAAASPQFTVEDGVLKGKTFSPNHPGQPLSVDEFILLQTKENSFCFGISSGGGATGNKGGGGTSSVKVIRNPDARTLGDAANAKSVKDGTLRFEYD